jgi:hypothetical protein
VNLDSKLTVPPQVMSRLVGDETVLLDLASGMYFGVDQVAQRIWELIGEGKALGQIVTIIVSEFDVEEGQAQADVLAFANELVERGLLAA